MRRSVVTVDLAAIRRNAALRETAAPAELWAVVKAQAYGHGAVGAARAALEGGASGLCVATAREGEDLREAFPSTRILVMSPLAAGEDAARDARLELALSSPNAPEGLDVHVKVDTGMGRWGMTLEEALSVPRGRVVGVMSHLATADEEDESFARDQIRRFREVTAAFPGIAAHLANSAGALRFPEARFDAVRTGSPCTGCRRSATTPLGTSSSRRSPGEATSPTCGSWLPGEHRLRAPVRRGGAGARRHRPGRVRRRLPARPRGRRFAWGR